MHNVTEKLEQQQESGAEEYLKKYRDQVEFLESKSVLSRVKESQGGISAYDIYALGNQLDSWNEYRDMHEAEGTLADLGKLPDMALDVITVAYGTSPLSTLASTQQLDDEQGTVHFKDVVASTTRGNVTAGDKIFNPDAQADITPESFSGDLIVENVGTTVAATLSYAVVLAEAPVRPYKVTVRVVSLGLTATDDGNGVLNGNGIYGTVNYTTGAVNIDFAVDPGNGNAMEVTYSVDFEGATDLPRIGMQHRTKSVRARIWALKSVMGLFQSFVLRKRFGKMAEDETATDLVSAINAEMMNAAIAILRANVQGNTNFTQAPPSGVSFFEHKQTFKDTLQTAESVLLGNADRGVINVIIAGRTVTALIATLPGFQKISDATSIGPHIYGTLDGVIVIRVPNQNILPVNEALCLYKGPTPWEAPLVHGTFMPLIVTPNMGTGTNPITNQKAAAVWASLDPLIPNFSTKITFV